MRLVQRWSVGLLAAAIPVAATAHDLWLEPSTYFAQTSQRVTIGIRIGDDFDGLVSSLDPERTLRFDHVGPSFSEPVVAIPGFDPSGIVTGLEAGTHVVGYETAPSSIELRPESFYAYVEKEGLPIVPTSSGPVRELFSRSVKTLFHVADGRGRSPAPTSEDRGRSHAATSEDRGRSRAATSDHEGRKETAHDRVLGLPLELLADQNPLLLGPGEPLRLTLLFGGEPIGGVLVTAISANDPDQRSSARTEPDGRVTLAVDAPGAWLVKAVHITRWHDEREAEWRSWWASLTFARPHS